jgi:hypothetical protein
MPHLPLNEISVMVLALAVLSCAGGDLNKVRVHRAEATKALGNKASNSNKNAVAKAHPYNMGCVAAIVFALLAMVVSAASVFMSSGHSGDGMGSSSFFF